MSLGDGGVGCDGAGAIRPGRGRGGGASLVWFPMAAAGYCVRQKRSRR